MKTNPRAAIVNSIIAAVSAFGFFDAALAQKTDLSIIPADLTFSKEDPVEREIVRIFARVFNLGETDVLGSVVFLDNDKEITSHQPISVKTNAYDDVFVDKQLQAGSHNIKVRIIDTNLRDENAGNNEAVRENYIVDLDSDGDKTGDKKDPDDDNDGLSDQTEIALGTDPLNPDTDKDKIKDNIDSFPLNPKEWQDFDQDKIGGNEDADDDNDGLTDEDEIFIFGSNPLSEDTDKDGLPDAKEKVLGTNILAEDSDQDGVIDSKDPFPLDPGKNGFSFSDTIKNLLQKKKLPNFKIWAGAGLLFLFFLFLSKRKKKKH